MAVRNTSIFGKVYLFSDTVVCAFSEGAFGEIIASPQDLPNSQYIFVDGEMSFLAVLSSNS